MSALEFDGLLSSHSVFVSPVDRYGQPQHTDKYTHAKVTDDDECGGGHDVRGDPQWRWAGPTIPGGLDDFVVDQEPTAIEPQQQQQWQEDNGATLSPERLPPADDDGDSWEDGSRSRGGSYDNDDDDGDDGDDGADRSWARGPSVDDSINDGADTQHGAPSPVVRAQEPLPPPPPPPPPVSASPPSASHNFEDQPIRGLAGAKEMSLDELIAQGERQMQEAQAKTALLKPKPSSSSSSAAAMAGAGGRQGGRLGSANDDEDNKGSSSNNSNNNSRPTARQPPETEGPSSHGTNAAMIRAGAAPPSGRGDSGANNGSVRSSRASNFAWSAGGGGGGGAGVRVSLRSGASVGTSWSGGDLSMGVTPAVAAGEAAGAEEGEEEEGSREERERREFYELEMELLREEERGGEGAGGGGLYRDRGAAAAAVVGNGGRQEQHGGDFWDDEQRDGLTGGLGLEPAAESRAG